MGTRTSLLYTSLSFSVSPTTVIQETYTSAFLLDTGQNPATGVPATDLAFLPGHDIGAEYYIVTPMLGFPNPVAEVIDASTNQVVGTAPITISGQQVSFRVPRRLLGYDDGNLNMVGLVGTWNGPTDYIPDSSHLIVER
jgi:hypothetical protein